MTVRETGWNNGASAWPGHSFRSEIEADYWQNYLLQSQQRDEEKGLQLIIDAKNRDGVLRKLFQYQIQADYIQSV